MAISALPKYYARSDKTNVTHLPRKSRLLRRYGQRHLVQRNTAQDRSRRSRKPASTADAIPQWQPRLRPRMHRADADLVNSLFHRPFHCHADTPQQPQHIPTPLHLPRHLVPQRRLLHLLLRRLNTRPHKHIPEPHPNHNRPNPPRRGRPIHPMGRRRPTRLQIPRRLHLHLPRRAFLVSFTPL